MTVCNPGCKKDWVLGSQPGSLRASATACPPRGGQTKTDPIQVKTDGVRAVYSLISQRCVLQCSELLDLQGSRTWAPLASILALCTRRIRAWFLAVTSPQLATAAPESEARSACTRAQNDLPSSHGSPLRMPCVHLQKLLIARDAEIAGEDARAVPIEPKLPPPASHGHRAGTRRTTEHLGDSLGDVL